MISSGYIVTENDIKITKLGKLKIINHRHKVGMAKSCTISMTPTGDFYISILWKDEEILEKPEMVTKEVGIDLGLKDLVICSDGENFQYYNLCEKNY